MTPQERQAQQEYFLRDSLAQGNVNPPSGSRWTGPNTWVAPSGARQVSTNNVARVIQPTQPRPSSNNTNNDSRDRIDREEERQRKAAEDARKAMLAQINADYSSWTNELGRQETQWNEQTPLTIAGIEQQLGASTADLQGQQEGQMNDLSNQVTQAQQGTQGVLSTARQTYNELLSGLNKFQGSTGDAVSELLGQQTAKTIGGAQQALQGTLSGIAQERTRLTNYYNAKVNDLKQKAQLYIQQAQQELRNAIGQINSQRSQAKGWKASQNVQALAQFQQRVADIKDAAATAKNALDQWTQEMNLARQSSAEGTANKYTLKPTDLAQLGLSIQPSQLGSYAGYLQNPTPEGLQGITFQQRPDLMQISPGSQLYNSSTNQYVNPAIPSTTGGVGQTGGAGQLIFDPATGQWRQG